MMYSFYLDKTLLPVAPSKLQVKINNKNKTMTLLNTGEINILKQAGLTEITFDALLPNSEYPFAVYKQNEFKNAEYFLDIIKNLKISNAPFRFIVIRETQGGDGLFDTNMKVSLEDYTITDDVDNGTDITVSIKLKQYKDYSTKMVVIPTTTETDQAAVAVVSPPVEERPVESSPTPQTYTVVEGDCLWNICKEYLGDGNKYQEIADLNGISNPDLIYPGQVIKLG